MVEIDEKKIFSIIQKAKESGSLKIGINEVTKAIERKQVKLVIYATDVSPSEIVAHVDGLCSEMDIVCVKMGTKAEFDALISDIKKPAVSKVEEVKKEEVKEEKIEKKEEEVKED